MTVNVAPIEGTGVLRTVTVNVPRTEVYAFWRDFENLPRFMKHLESVTVLDSKRSHWVAKAPAGANVEWNAEITSDVPGSLIAWRSVDESDVDNAGTVRFVDAPGGRGTEVQVTLIYDAPAGAFGKLIAKMFGEEPEQQIREDMRRFKCVVETGELATIVGQPTGEGRYREDA